MVIALLVYPKNGANYKSTRHFLGVFTDSAAAEKDFRTEFIVDAGGFTPSGGYLVTQSIDYCATLPHSLVDY